MENPASWGKAEHVVDNVLGEWWANREKQMTDPTKRITGPSLARQITDALREAGLLERS